MKGEMKIDFGVTGKLWEYGIGEGRFTVSSSEFVEARKAREAKHVEYEKLAEESALKQKMLEQEIEERYYKRNLVNQAAFKAYEKNIMEL